MAYEDTKAGAASQAHGKVNKGAAIRAEGKDHLKSQKRAVAQAMPRKCIDCKKRDAIKGGNVCSTCSNKYPY